MVDAPAALSGESAAEEKGMQKNAAPAMVRVTNLRKVYRVGSEKVVALDNVSLEIPRGEVCCLLGTSGSGKSTLLNMIAGLEKPTKGSVVVNGRRVDRMSEKELAKFRQESLGFVFQSYNLLPALTALENVSLPLTFRGMKKAQRESMAREMLTLVGLESHIVHKPTQMSGGQQQRVGIARAFVAHAPVMLADEPTGNLDSKTTREVMHLMIDAARKNDQTLILVTHDRDVALYADRVVRILDGNIESIEYVDPALHPKREEAHEEAPAPVQADQGEKDESTITRSEQA